MGIDAPELTQPCHDGNGNDYLCGAIATEALRNKIGDTAIRYVGQGRGRYGRLLGECYFGDESLNQWLVHQGYALAYRRNSKQYVREEDEARTT